MKNVLEELWYGNLCLQEQGTGYTAKMKEISEKMDRARDAISENMTADQRQALEQYDDAIHAMYSIFEKDAFITGVRFATGYWMEAMKA